MKSVIKTCLLSLSIVNTMAAENSIGDKTVLNEPEAGSVSTQQGLDSWSRVYEVASHPRCANCHVGNSPYPMWSGPSFTKTQRHGMNINAGASRMGVEYIMCSTCHTGSNSEADHGAPGVKDAWRLAPVEADWFGKSSVEICQQLRDPKRNGNRTYQEIASHLGHDVILHWAWNPGGEREPAPYSLQEHMDDIMLWGVAGMPCPDDINSNLNDGVSYE